MAQGGISPVPREARPYQGRRAGFVTRAVAATIDGIVVGTALLVGYLTFSGLLFLLHPRGFGFPEVGLFFSLFSAFVTLVVYLTVSWWLSGRSYGCLVMGLRVLGPRQRALRLPLALLRAVSCAVFPIGLVWVAVSRDNRSVQDTVLRTSVVYDWQPRGEAWSRGGPSAGEDG
jgi:uncharacterized RDD family membrane protein YckC